MKTVTNIVRAIDREEHFIMEYLTASRKVQRAIEQTAKATFSTVSQMWGGGCDPYLFTRQSEFAKGNKNERTINEYEQVVQYLSAAESSGIANLCQWSTVDCSAGCVQTAGRLRF